MSPRRILIIKLGAMGDLLMATPALRALRQASPGARITLMVGRSCLPAVTGCPFVDEVWEVDDNRIYHGPIWRKLLEALKIAFRGRNKFDQIFCWHRDRRFALLVRSLGGKRRIGLSYKEKDFLLTDTVHIEGVKHHIDHYIATLIPLGIDSSNRAMVFPLDDGIRIWGKDILEKEFHLRTVVAVAPGGAKNVKEEMASRRWPLDHYRKLATILVKQGVGVILLGNKDDAFADSIFMGMEGVRSFIGKTDLKETAALMASSQAVVTHDSGPMHLASAVGTPVFSIFGPTDPREKAPLNKGSEYFWKPETCPEAPCYQNGVFPDCGNKSCTSAVLPEEVFSALEGLLGSGKRE